MGRADGRGVLMGCHEPLAGGGGQCTRLARSGPREPGHASGHFEMLQALLWMGWRAAKLSRGCHKRRETWWDRGRCAATISARRREWGTLVERVERAYGDWLSAAVVAIVALAVLGEWS